MKNNARILYVLLILVLGISLVGCPAAVAPDNILGAPMGDAYLGMMGGVEGDLSGEDYTEIVENAFVNAAETPDSYFSIDANTASYPNLRRYLQQGYLNIPKDAVRVEEMLNYFDYYYEKPTDGSVLALTSSVFDNPYNPATKLMTIGLAAQEIEFKDIRNNLPELPCEEGYHEAQPSALV